VLSHSRHVRLDRAVDAARDIRQSAYARALRETFRRVIRHLEFDPAVSGGSVITVDENMVKSALSSRDAGTASKR